MRKLRKSWKAPYKKKKAWKLEDDFYYKYFKLHVINFDLYVFCFKQLKSDLKINLREKYDNLILRFCTYTNVYGS